MRSLVAPPHTVSAIIVGLFLVGCGTPAQSVPSTPQPEQPGSSAATSPSASAGGQSNTSGPSASATASAAAAVWRSAGNLGEARNATNVVVVGEGEVLVVGSDYVCGAATAGSDSVEIGDPQAGVWERATSLASRREDPVLVALPDGRALLTGGMTGEDGGPTAYASTYIFDPADGSWSQAGAMKTPRSGAAAAALRDGRVLVAGGLYIDRGGQRDLDGAELWDPASGNWSDAGRLAGNRIGGSAVTLADGRVLVVGGLLSNADQIRLASAEVFDPDTGRWSAAGTLATTRNGFNLVALADGGALVAGGFVDMGTGATRRESTVERFDPASNTWTLTGDLPGPVAGASGVRLADGRVLLAGGSARDPQPIDTDAGTFVSGLTADASLFDPATGGWTATTRMPRPRVGASAVLLADGSAILVGGSASEADPGSTSGCPDAEPEVVRYLPGS